MNLSDLTKYPGFFCEENYVWTLENKNDEVLEFKVYDKSSNNEYPVYHAKFGIRNRTFSEEGTYDIEFWKHYVKDRIHLTRTFVDDSEIIAEAYHLPWIRDFSSFVDIYFNCGFECDNKFDEDKLEELFKREYEWPYEELNELTGEMHIPVVVCKVYSEPDLPKPIMRIEITANKAKALVAENLYYSDGLLDLDKIFNRDVYTIISDEDLEVFDAAYPNLKVKNYISNHNDRNILIPLFCKLYDYGLFQLVQNELFIIAEQYFKYNPLYTYTFLDAKCPSERFCGLPIEILRKLDRSALGVEELFEIVKYIEQKNPEWIDETQEITSRQIRNWLKDMPDLLMRI